jgi:hypothetical protein
MQLVIKDGKVRATYLDNVDILDRYDLTEYEVVEWDGPGEFQFDPETGELADDPRTPAQQNHGVSERYKRRRRRAYPSTHRMLLMIYHDMKNGTNEFVDAIDAIHDQFPKE